MTQKETVLDHLKAGHTLTCMSAFRDFGITQIAFHIHTLKNEGHPIKSDMVKVGTRYGNTTSIAQYYYGKPGDDVDPVQGSLDL
jgi:aspartate carbamoyltransferase regulatory subunit